MLLLLSHHHMGLWSSIHLARMLLVVVRVCLLLLLVIILGCVWAISVHHARARRGVVRLTLGHSTHNGPTGVGHIGRVQAMSKLMALGIPQIPLLLLSAPLIGGRRRRKHGVWIIRSGDVVIIFGESSQPAKFVVQVHGVVGVGLCIDEKIICQGC